METNDFSPQFQLNNNGDSAREIIDACIRTHRLADKLIEQLQLMGTNVLHGRNFQSYGDKADKVQQNDKQIVTDMVEAVKSISAYTMAGAARGVKQREGL